MPFEKGNKLGGNHRTHGLDALAKVQKAIARGIEQMKDPNTKKVIGVVRLAEKITEALEADPIRTLKALSAYMPKNVQIDLSDSRQADAIPDSELAQLIAEGAAKAMTDEADELSAIMH